MNRRRGLTLAELIMALAITAIVGAGVVAMTDAVGTALDSGRLERERTIASATASTRLSSIIAPSSCSLEISSDLTVLWRGDSRRDGNVQATELGWIRYEADRGELLFEWIEFPEGWSARDQEDADRTCSPDENWALVRSEYRNAGHLKSCILLDGLEDVEPALEPNEQQAPLEQRRIAWRLSWQGVTGVDATTVVTSGIHNHMLPEGTG